MLWNYLSVLFADEAPPLDPLLSSSRWWLWCDVWRFEDKLWRSLKTLGSAVSVLQYLPFFSHVVAAAISLRDGYHGPPVCLRQETSCCCDTRHDQFVTGAGVFLQETWRPVEILLLETTCVIGKLNLVALGIYHSFHRVVLDIHAIMRSWTIDKTITVCCGRF